MHSTQPKDLCLAPGILTLATATWLALVVWVAQMA